MPCAQPEFADAAREWYHSVLPENLRWLALFVTQRLIQSCLGHDTDADDVHSRFCKHTATTAGSASHAPAADKPRTSRSDSRLDSKLRSLSHRLSARPMHNARGTTDGSSGGSNGSTRRCNSNGADPPAHANRQICPTPRKVSHWFAEGTVEFFWYSGPVKRASVLFARP